MGHDGEYVCIGTVKQVVGWDFSLFPESLCCEAVLELMASSVVVKSEDSYATTMVVMSRIMGWTIIEGW